MLNETTPRESALLHPLRPPALIARMRSSSRRRLDGIGPAGVRALQFMIVNRRGPDVPEDLLRIIWDFLCPPPVPPKPPPPPPVRVRPPQAVLCSDGLFCVAIIFLSLWVLNGPGDWAAAALQMDGLRPHAPRRLGQGQCVDGLGQQLGRRLGRARDLQACLALGAALRDDGAVGIEWEVLPGDSGRAWRSDPRGPPNCAVVFPVLADVDVPLADCTWRNSCRGAGARWPTPEDPAWLDGEYGAWESAPGNSTGPGAASWRPTDALAGFVLQPVGGACVWTVYQRGRDFEIYTRLDGQTFTPRLCAKVCDALPNCTGFESPADGSYCAPWLRSACSQEGAPGYHENAGYMLWSRPPGVPDGFSRRLGLDVVGGVAPAPGRDVSCWALGGVWGPEVAVGGWEGCATINATEAAATPVRAVVLPSGGGEPGNTSAPQIHPIDGGTAGAAHVEHIAFEGCDSSGVRFAAADCGRGRLLGSNATGRLALADPAQHPVPFPGWSGAGPDIPWAFAADTSSGTARPLCARGEGFDAAGVLAAVPSPRGVLPRSPFTSYYAAAPGQLCTAQSEHSHSRYAATPSECRKWIVELGYEPTGCFPTQLGMQDVSTAAQCREAAEALGIPFKGGVPGGRRVVPQSPDGDSRIYCRIYEGAVVHLQDDILDGTVQHVCSLGMKMSLNNRFLSLHDRAFGLPEPAALQAGLTCLTFLALVSVVTTQLSRMIPTGRVMALRTRSLPLLTSVLGAVCGSLSIAAFVAVRKEWRSRSAALFPADSLCRGDVSWAAGVVDDCSVSVQWKWVCGFIASLLAMVLPAAHLAAGGCGTNCENDEAVARWQTVRWHSYTIRGFSAGLYAAVCCCAAVPMALTAAAIIERLAATDE
eukprot:TRINITY_DN15814_c0_g1_i1.p1 TRINITY_DN15814_c0_g1~~TRINITY_DN15814_c0_g1_i1.p1  ORF type:complete len:874 (+),score=168.94 TRINITY_DN15814_c0_g1_i1:99-2720(+)